MPSESFDTIGGKSAADLREATSNKDYKIPAYIRNVLANTSIPFEVQYPNGTTATFGAGPPEFTVRLRNDRGFNAVASLDEMRVGDAYVQGDIELEGDLLRLFEFRSMFTDSGPLVYLWRFLQPLLFGQLRTNRRVISTHYDVDSSFFMSFLDPKVPSYTQGVFENDTDTLADATLRKLEYCFEKLQLKPGQRILDIGPGWGAWLEYASARGVHCTGITISKESAEFLRARSAELGYDWEIIIADLLAFSPGVQYDAITIMGVMEHLPQYDTVVRQFQSLVKPGGRIFLDASADVRKYQVATFLVKYIYPGNHSFLVLHDFLEKMAKTELRLLELHNDRHSYFLTARAWSENLDRNAEYVKERFGAEKYRAFRLYLWGTAFAFMRGGLDCYRMILWRRS